MNKFLIYIFFFIILSNCGFGKKDINEKKDVRDLFKKVDPIQKEFNPNLDIKLTKINATNINFDTNFKKKSLYKFSSIDKFNINQPELIFFNDGVIFFDRKGSIFKISKELKKIWKVNHYSKKEKKLGPILYFSKSGKNLVVADNISKIYLINSETGKLVWSNESLSPFNSNIKVFKDKILAVDFDNIIRCFSIKDGKELWNFVTENSFIKSQKKLSILLKDENVYFINNLGDVTSLNINDGSLIWQTPTQKNTIYQNAFSLKNSDLVLNDNTIFFSNNKNEIFSIDARNGIVRWKQTVNSSIKPRITESLIFSISNEGFLFVIDEQRGNILRINNLLKGIKNKKNKIQPTGFILAKNKIFMSLNNGRLIKADIATGAQENIIKIGKSKISKPYIFDNSMYLVRDNAIIKIN